MEILCPKCGERCEVDFEPVIGQHIICPFCEVKFSYGEAQADPEPAKAAATSARTIMAVCPYCGHGEPVEEECVGQVGVCLECQGEFTIMPNAKGIPFEPQSISTGPRRKKRAKCRASVVSQLDPGLLAKMLFMGGAATVVVSIVFAWSWPLLFGVLALIVGALAPKFGATSDMKHMARYLATCAVCAVVVGGGCYGMRQNAIQKDQRAVALKKGKVDSRIQELSMHYFGHELCEWFPRDTDESTIELRGANPFAQLQGGDGVEKSVVINDWDGSLFELRAELSHQTRIPADITREFAQSKVNQFKSLSLITKITRLLGKEPHFVRHSPLAGELVSLNAEYVSDERTEEGKPLVSVTVSYSLSCGRLLANQSGRESGSGYSDRESWTFEIFYNGR